MARLTRRAFLGAAAAAVAGGSYLRWGEPRWLVVHRVTVAVANQTGTASMPLRILHLSDFHVSPVVPLEFIAEAIRLGLAQRPDVVALTGDFITDDLPNAADYAAVLRTLSDAVPTFASLGNHDGGHWAQRAGGAHTPVAVQTLLRDAGIACLVNGRRDLTVKGRRVAVTGVGDLWSRQCEPERAFARGGEERAGTLRLLLNHNPDAKELLQPYPWDLMLCGHTHGGQLRLPLLGTPFAPVKDKRYVEGLHRWDDRWLYITRGVGNLHGVRFNCRPQVSVVDVA